MTTNNKIYHIVREKQHGNTKDDGEPIKPNIAIFNTPCKIDLCYNNLGERCSDCLFIGKGKYGR